jgi:hypothetical protein
MRSRSASLMIPALLCLGACWGCGAEGSGALPPLIPVKGKVTYKGKPLTKGLVKFQPDGGYGRSARGELQADGTFVLSTNKEGDGVVAGSHRISITDLDKSLAKDRALKKYASQAASGLTAEVDNEHTEFTFELK